MTYNWQKAIDFVMKWEGGYTDDTGGPTKYGISQKSYPDLNIETLTPDEAKDIYKKDYWDKCRCDELGYPWDVVVFDTAVNCGVIRTLNWFEATATWQEFLLKRIYHYVQLAKKEALRTFLRGWLNRTMDLYMVINDNK